ncbi:MAG: hypothetical protein JXR10_14655 [Cyclobacteriaceae bacterium]
MGFNELNSVEYYIIHQLSGTNLNSETAEKPKVSYSNSMYKISLSFIGIFLTLTLKCQVPFVELKKDSFIRDQVDMYLERNAELKLNSMPIYVHFSNFWHWDLATLDFTSEVIEVKSKPIDSTVFLTINSTTRIRYLDFRMPMAYTEYKGHLVFLYVFIEFDILRSDKEKEKFLKFVNKEYPLWKYDGTSYKTWFLVRSDGRFEIKEMNCKLPVCDPFPY